MIAIDTNILVYAHRRDSPYHEAALQQLNELGRGAEPWAVPWPCVHEFLAVVTSQRLFENPTPLDVALDQVQEFAAAGAHFLGEGHGHLVQFGVVASQMNATGLRIHDAKIAAICLAQGISELWTLDRDFSGVAGLRVRNPLAS